MVMRCLEFSAIQLSQLADDIERQQLGTSIDLDDLSTRLIAVLCSAAIPPHRPIPAQLTARSKFVAYYRVSRADQGRIGLSLEAQQKSLSDYVKGEAWEQVATFTEVETGKRTKNRPQLAEALNECKKHKATLIIAKLDRLRRNAAFLLALRDSGAELRACDLPKAGTLEFGVRAVVAQYEREEISKRSIAALAVVKAQEEKGPRMKGGKVLKPLGWNGKHLANINKAAADTFSRLLAPTVRALQIEHPTVRALTTALNAAAVTTARSGRWQLATVHRLLQRIGGL